MKSSNNDRRNFLLLVSLLIVAGLIWNGIRDRTGGAVDVDAQAAKQISAIVVDKMDQSIEFNGDDSEIKWSCANALGQVQVGYFYQLDGTAILDTANDLKRLEVELDVTEMRANAASLSSKLQGPGFFQTETFPTSTFVSTSISNEPRDSDPVGTTHVVEGNFQIRDVTKSISFPVAVKFEDGKFSMSSAFKLNRKDFGIVHHVAVEDKGIHEDVLLNIDIQVDTQTEQPEHEQPASWVGEGTDRGPRFTEEIPATLAQFEMIKVPGDPSQGMADFYLGKCEVTWEEFDYWALCKDLAEKQAVLARNQLLRPSAPHDLEAIYRNWGRKDQPVVGVSRKSAELYCQWLSEQTGKKYRLPTSAEWLHALELGGDAAIQDKEEVAWFEPNTLDDDGFDNRAMQVGTRQPNQLGIHDMLGNVSEWVLDEPVVRGGNFLTQTEELSGTLAETEDQNVWNATYPQLPKSIWWYKDADYVGFRVVCEAK
jgi:formylglycine-generating enzyme required for sulfatase activity/polyisoprenoid-binding protein YceI